MKRAVLLSVIVLLVVVARSNGIACPSCFGDPESPMTDGMNAGILFLLGITGTVLTTISLFFLYLRKRWVEVNRPFRNMLN